MTLPTTQQLRARLTALETELARTPDAISRGRLKPLILGVRADLARAEAADRAAYDTTHG